MGSTLPGNVRVLDKLGETPEGPLYRAEYPTGLEVALVILHPQRNGREASDDSVALLRLQQQVRQAIQIQHLNVAAVYEIGETPDGFVYVVMEYLAGELLSNILAARGALPLDEALDLCLQAAAGLQAAHRAGLVHGNLSPRTILITEAADGHPRVKLIRFPLASSLLEQRPNRPTDIAVSAEYASPERLSGHTPDELSDVFSLGAVLHHLLTGRPPDGSRVGSVPDVTRAVLTQALAWVPAQRFQTISEFASAVERAAAVASRPKRTGANRSLVLGAVGASLVVITAGLSWPWSLRRQPVSAARPAQETGTRAPPSAEAAENAETRSTPQETGRIMLVARDSAPGRISTRAANGRSPPPLHRAPAAVERSPDSTARPIKTSARAGSDPITPKMDKPPASGVRSDSAPPPKLSSFRRSHPWAAVPGKRFYFRSSCRVALQSTDLLYFKSEDEARASGFVPTRVPGCY